MGHQPQLQGKRVVVTGGAGFIGSHLCDALLEGDNSVTCVDNLVGTRGSTGNLAHVLGHPRFELVVESVVDWADRADLTDVDCIFHLAASKHAVSLRDPEHDLTVNGLGTLRLLLRAVRDGVSSDLDQRRARSVSTASIIHSNCARKPKSSGIDG